MSAHAAPHHYAVANPAVAEVIDAREGDVLEVRALIGTDYGELQTLRMRVAQALAEDNPLYLCAFCHVPVHLVRLTTTRRFFFRHKLEDGRCTAVTRGALSEQEINARKYNGAKESAAHVRMKNIVADSLRADPRFSEVEVEGIWKGQRLGEWRRPDVRAVVDGTPVAFEIQLSTTFLRVIAERRNFYRRAGGLLFWVFREFREEDALMTQDDIFYNNNRNAFLVSEQTRDASCKARALALECRWQEAVLVDGAVEHRYKSALVTYDQLNVDRNAGRIYYYDYDEELRSARKQARLYEQANLRSAFELFWLPRLKGGQFDRERWGEIRARFEEHGLILPEWPDDEPAMLLNALYSAREGRPIGWSFKKLVQVVHQIAENRKQYLRLVRVAMKVYERTDQIIREDAGGKLRQKAVEYVTQMQAGHVSYEPDTQFNDLVEYLFPRLREHLVDLDLDSSRGFRTT